MALIALSALLCRLVGVPAESGQAALCTPEQSAAPPSAISLPPLPGLDALSEPIASLVLTLNRLGTRRDNPILMYRHLAYWPSYLAVSWALIAPLDAGGSLERAIADALTEARTQVARLAMRLRPPPLDPAAEEAGVNEPVRLGKIARRNPWLEVDPVLTVARVESSPIIVARSRPRTTLGRILLSAAA